MKYINTKYIVLPETATNRFKFGGVSRLRRVSTLLKGLIRQVHNKKTEMYTNRCRSSQAAMQVRSSETDTHYRRVRGSDFRPVHSQQPHPRKPGPALLLHHSSSIFFNSAQVCF